MQSLKSSDLRDELRGHPPSGGAMGAQSTFDLLGFDTETDSVFTNEMVKDSCASNGIAFIPSPVCDTYWNNSRYIFFRNSISVDLSDSLMLVPYSCPAFELPGSRVSNIKAPAKGLLVMRPTCWGSNSQLPM